MYDCKKRTTLLSRKRRWNIQAQTHGHNCAHFLPSCIWWMHQWLRASRHAAEVHVWHTINILQHVVFPLTTLCSVFAPQVLIRHSQALSHWTDPDFCSVEMSERNRVVVCRFIVDGAHVDPAGWRQIKVLLALKTTRWRGERRRRRGTRSTVTAHHCTTVSRRRFGGIPLAASAFSPYRSVFEFAALVFVILWAGAKNQGSATIQQIKLRDPGAFIRAMWGQTEMPSDSERP